MKARLRRLPRRARRDLARRGPSFTAWIFLGLSGGILTGLFLGEYAESLKVMGDIYVGLMQMTVLPYIVFSLIGNIGSLSLRDFGLLARAGLLIFVGLWALAALTVLGMSQALPELPVGQFFSAALVDPPPKPDFLSIFIPSNPFKSLADNSVPAVVVFCILFGVAIIGFEEKKSLLDHVGLIAKTLHRVNGLVVRLTPIGVFGIAAHAAGTMSVEEFGRLQAYYLTFAGGVLLLTFGTLPLLVASLTPFSYGQVLRAGKDALITALVTGSVLPVIPLLIDGVKAMFQQRLPHDRAHEGFPEFILPLAYPFPNSGNVIDLVFIPFAAWFVGNPLDLGDQLFMLGSSLFLLFGKVFLSIPFLLNSFHIPQDMFQLFLAAGVLAARVGDVLSSMHYLVFTILATATMTGLLRVNWKRLLWGWAFMLLLMIIVIALIRLALGLLASPEFGKASALARMTLLENQVYSYVEPGAAPNPIPLRAGESRLSRIKRRGTIRVGYRPDYVPYSYLNGRGELVGFDVDLVNRLALDLQVGVEFIPYRIEDLADQLRADHFDIAVSGLTVTLPRAEAMLMSEPYLIVNMGVVVEDYRSHEFASEARINRLGRLRLGVSNGSFFEDRAREHFPNAEIVPLDSIRLFFDDPSLHLDALITQAESGAAWTLIYPNYSVVNPLQRRDSAPVSIAIAGFDPGLDQALATWVTLKKLDGTIDKLFQHWMLGKMEGPGNKRWSIARDVLHWIE